MSKVIDFDAALESRVQAVVKKLELLARVIDGHPDSYTQEKHDKVFAYLTAVLHSNQIMAKKVIDVQVTNVTPFSLAAPPVSVLTPTPPIPLAGGGRLSRFAPDYSGGQPTIDDTIDGVDFIEE